MPYLHQFPPYIHRKEDSFRVCAEILFERRRIFDTGYTSPIAEIVRIPKKYFRNKWV